MPELLNVLPDQPAFATVLNDSFSAESASAAGEVRTEFTLVECRHLTSGERQECFSLIFAGPPDLPQEQCIYRLTNDRLGAMDLFLVPIRRDDRGLHFEAIVNRLILE